MPILTTQFLIHAFSIWDYQYSCVNLIPSSPLISWFLFMFLVIACTCVPEPHHFNPVHVWLPVHANWLHLTYSLGYFLTTLNFHVQIWESGPWWTCWSWSQYATEAWISGCLSGAPFLSAPLNRLARFSSCYSWVFSVFLYCISCFCASLWSIFMSY